MNLADYDKVSVADLWENYQKNLEKGDDKAYIERCDYVKVQSAEYFDKEEFPADSTGRKVAGQTLVVVAQCKVATDLWYTTVAGNDGKDYVLYDAEIECVYKLKDKCKRCMDCFFLVDNDDRYFCDGCGQNCTDINICRELREQFYEDIARKFGIEEDIVTQVVIDNFDGRDLDELSDSEYDDLIKILVDTMLEDNNGEEIYI